MKAAGNRAQGDRVCGLTYASSVSPTSAVNYLFANHPLHCHDLSLSQSRSCPPPFLVLFPQCPIHSKHIGSSILRLCALQTLH